MERVANHADDSKVTVCIRNDSSEAEDDEDLEKDLDQSNRINTTTTDPSNDSPANPSVDSSTDTLIPSNDSLFDVTTPDKPTQVS